jgi:MFS family permease
MDANPGAKSAFAAQRKRDLLRSFFLSTVDGIFAIPIGTISLPANLLLISLVTQAYPLPDSTIGFFMALPFIANFFLIFPMPPPVQRWTSKKLTAVSASLHLLTWIALAVMLPWLPRDDLTRAGEWLIAWFFVSSIFSAVNGVAWNSWTQEWVPARLRGKFFGRRNRFVQFSALAFLLVAGWLLGRGKSAIAAFQVIIAGVAVMRLVSLRCMWINPTRARQPVDETKLPLRYKLAVLLNSRSFLVFVAFGCIWSFAANCFGPFYQVFMFGEMRMSAFDVGVTATLAQLGGALSLPVWGQLLDRYGNKPVMIVSLVFWQLSNFFWCFLAPANRDVLYLLWLWAGATGAGFVLGQFTILLRLIPLEAKNLAIGFNLAITSLFAAAAPIGGGYALEWALARTSDSLAVYHVCFLLQPVLALAGAFLLLRVHEPAASPLSVVVGAMRNIRTLGGVLGLSFLTNYLFLKPSRKSGDG